MYCQLKQSSCKLLSRNQSIVGKYGLIALEMAQRNVCMQAKVHQLDDLSTQQASQIATLCEELQGSLAELDQVCILNTSLISVLPMVQWNCQTHCHKPAAQAIAEH